MGHQRYVGFNVPMLSFGIEDRARLIAQMHRLRSKWVRLEMPLWNLNPARGVWNLTEMDDVVLRCLAAGLKLLVYVRGSQPFSTSAPATAPEKSIYPPIEINDYTDALAFLMRRYPGIKYWQIWNEQNTPNMMANPDPVKYRGMLQAVRDMVNNSIDLVKKKIVLGGLAYFGDIPGGTSMVDALISNGGLRLVDVVAYHGFYPQDPTDETELNTLKTKAIALNTKLRAAGVKKIWLTESGASTYSTGPEDYQKKITKNQQTAFLVWLLQAAKDAGFDKFFIFALTDVLNLSLRDNAFGLLTSDGGEKPAFHEIKYAIKTIYG